MKLGILGATSEEITPLLEYYKDYQTIDFGGNRYYQVRLGNAILTIAYSRIGKVHSALSASSMHLHFGCEKIVFNGVAGGLNEKLKVGDLLLGTELCQHDADITAFGHPHGFFSEGQIFYKTDKELNEVIKSAAADEGIILNEGIIATGDQFINSKEKKDWIKKEFKADVAEMEGASVAVVCHNLNVPLAVLRSISDSADESAFSSYDEFLDFSSKQSAQLIIKAVEKLTK